MADALNARCVLFGGGSHAASRLAPLAPVGETLDEVIDTLKQSFPKGVDANVVALKAGYDAKLEKA